MFLVAVLKLLASIAGSFPPLFHRFMFKLLEVGVVLSLKADFKYG